MIWPYGDPERCNALANGLVDLWDKEKECNRALEPEVQKRKEDVKRNAPSIIAQLQKESAGQPIKTYEWCKDCPYHKTIEDRMGMFDESGRHTVLCTLTPSPTYSADSICESERSEFRPVESGTYDYPRRFSEIRPANWCPLALFSQQMKTLLSAARALLAD